MTIDNVIGDGSWWYDEEECQ